jgi:hypothetical protein
MAAPTWRSPSPHHAAAKRQENGVEAWGVCHHLHASKNTKPSYTVRMAGRTADGSGQAGTGYGVRRLASTSNRSCHVATDGPRSRRLDRTPERLGHPAVGTTRRHSGRANRDIAACQSSHPSASSPTGEPRRAPAARTGTPGLPDPLAPPTAPHTPTRDPGAETAGVAPLRPAPSFLPKGSK